jgi:hypothetical protein
MPAVPWGVVLDAISPTTNPCGPFCREHAYEICRMKTSAVARRYKDPYDTWWCLPFELLPPRAAQESESWDGFGCWACHLSRSRSPLTLNRLLAPDPIGWGPTGHGRGRPMRRPAEVVQFLRDLDRWLDEVHDRAQLKDFAASAGMHPSTVRRWLRAGRRYGFSVHAKWKRVVTFRSP